MSEMELLEGKIAQLAALHKQAKDENRELRMRATQLELANRALEEKISTARARLEALAGRMAASPQEA